MTSIPTLTTERLYLRGPVPADLDAFVAFYGSERSQYVSGPKSAKDAWKLFAIEHGHWAIRGYGMWTVTLKGDDAPLGMVGMWYPEGWPEQELGWILYPEAEGKGLAYEAALAARKYAYSTLGWGTAVSYIDEPNMRSRKLAEKLGCKRDDAAETLDYDETPVLVYRHPAPAELSL